MKLIQDALEVVTRTYGVAIKPAGSRIRKGLLQSLFNLLRSRSEKIQVLAAAFRTELGHRCAIPAVMAFEPLSCGHSPDKSRRRDCTFVMGKRDCAVDALNRFSTG